MNEQYGICAISCLDNSKLLKYIKHCSYKKPVWIYVTGRGEINVKRLKEDRKQWDFQLWMKH